ncbi:MAG TPA: maltodextrin glucosidase, partial [Clostridiales bacterium]|nr:maltodextrin glucosidase [Clostridiales bacterium]
KAEKQRGSDANLRPCFDAPKHTQLTDFIARLAAAKKGSKALCYGDFTTRLLTNRQVIFERAFEDERVMVVINADDQPFTAHFNAEAGRARDLITGRVHDFGGGSELPPYFAAYWQVF